MFRPEEPEVGAPNLVPRIMPPNPARARSGIEELRRSNRLPRCPHGHFDGPSGLRVHEEGRGLTRLGPAHAVEEDRVIDVHRRAAQPQVPVHREAQHQEVRRAQDEVGRGDDVVPRVGLHAAPARAAAKGGTYDIMSSDTWRIISTPPTSDA